MTSSVVLAVNTAPSPATASATPASAASSGGSHSDFKRPLQEAHQQAKRTTSSSHPSSTSASATSPSPKGKAWSPHAAQDQDKDDSKSTKNEASDPATAMLALLGQSVPAMTPAVAAATPTGTADAPSATGITAAATLPGQLPGMTPLGTATAAGPATEGDEAGDDISALGGVKDNALSTEASDADDDIATALATAVSGSAKADPLAEATTGPATQSDHDNALDALRALTAAPTMQQPVAAQAAAPAHALAVNAQVGTPTFGQELGQQVAWLGGQDVKQARIRLNPEDLGPLDVKVSVTQSHVDVSFIVQHPQAVHAVQQTLTQLDSMLAQHGLTLGQTQVGQGGSGHASGQGAPSGSSASGDAESADGGAIASVESAVVTGVGLLDTFA